MKVGRGSGRGDDRGLRFLRSPVLGQVISRLGFHKGSITGVSLRGNWEPEGSSRVLLGFQGNRW